jgi:hypothetical protein
VRQPLDEPDRVGHEQLAAIRQAHPADERIEGHEQRVGRNRFPAGEAIEQGSLAGIRVADERHGRHCRLVTTFAELRPPLPNDIDVLRNDADAMADAAPVGFEFGFARTSCSDAAAKTREFGRGTDEPRHEVLQLRQLDLKFALPCACPTRKDIENQLRPVHNFSLEPLLEIAKLCRRQFVIEDNDINVEFIA